jgi:hypothetical protein
MLLSIVFSLALQHWFGVLPVSRSFSSGPIVMSRKYRYGGHREIHFCETRRIVG